MVNKEGLITGSGRSSGKQECNKILLQNQFLTSSFRINTLCEHTHEQQGIQVSQNWVFINTFS